VLSSISGGTQASDWISLTEVGIEFQARDAAAGNARSPMAVRRVGGTTSVVVEADLDVYGGRRTRMSGKRGYRERGMKMVKKDV